MNNEENCPKCGGDNTWLGPKEWVCLTCNHVWPEQDNGVGELVPSGKKLGETPKPAPLPKVDEPHPIRHQVENARIESKVMLHDMLGAETLGLRVAAMDFIHELTDWRIEDRNMQRRDGTNKMIENLRKRVE
jgi:hypothetical protein